MVLCLFIGTFLLLKSGIVSVNFLVAILLAGKIISLAFRVIRFFFKTVVWLVLLGILL